MYGEPANGRDGWRLFFCCCFSLLSFARKICVGICDGVWMLMRAEVVEPTDTDIHYTHTHAHVHVKWTVRLSKTKKESPSWLCSRIRSGVKLALPLMSVGRCVHIAASEQIHNHQCELAAEWRMVRMHVRFVRCRSHDIRTHIVRIRNATTKEEWTIERRAKKTRAHVFNTTTMATLRKVITCADARETK